MRGTEYVPGLLWPQSARDKGTRAQRHVLNTRALRQGTTTSATAHVAHTPPHPATGIPTYRTPLTHLTGLGLGHELAQLRKGLAAVRHMAADVTRHQTALERAARHRGAQAQAAVQQPERRQDLPGLTSIRCRCCGHGTRM